MDTKKLLKDYLCPKPWLLIITVAAFVIGFALIFVNQGAAFAIMMVDLIPLIIALAAHAPAIARFNKSIKQLEEKGHLDVAAAQFGAPNTIEICNAKAKLSTNFLFIKKRGVICDLYDVLWIYKHRQTTRYFMIPISVVDSLYVRTAKKIHDISLGKKDKKEVLTPAIMEIHKRNPRIMVGYNADNKKACDQLIKQAKQAAKNKK